MFNWQHFGYESDGYLNYDKIANQAKEYQPKLIVIGASAYPRHFDYKRMREIADSVGAYLMADIAHISGLIATGNAPNVFEYCHIVTSTTHKILRGPKGALIFGLNKHNDHNLMSSLHESVFPGFQGGPHNHSIAGIAACLHEAGTREYKEYIDQSLNYSKELASSLRQKGYDLLTSGTDTHIIVIDLRKLGLDGRRVASAFEACGISLTPAKIYGEEDPVKSGIRIGTTALFSQNLQFISPIRLANLLDLNLKQMKALSSITPLEEFVSAFKEHIKTNPTLQEELRIFHIDVKSQKIDVLEFDN